MPAPVSLYVYVLPNTQMMLFTWDINLVLRFIMSRLSSQSLLMTWPTCDQLSTTSIVLPHMIKWGIKQCLWEWLLNFGTVDNALGLTCIKQYIIHRNTPHIGGAVTVTYKPPLQAAVHRVHRQVSQRLFDHNYKNCQYISIKFGV